MTNVRTGTQFLICEYRIVVYGIPAPQGSKAFKGMRTSKATGKSNAVLVESSKKVKPWRKAVELAVRTAIAARADSARIPKDRDEAIAMLPPIDGPIMARVVFTLPKPKSAPVRRRTWPDRYPDVSKLTRSTEDAISSAGLWADDARVVEYNRQAKVFPGEDPEALDTPGCIITIYRIQETPHE